MGDGISRKRHCPGERLHGSGRHKGSISAAIIALCFGLATAMVAAPSDARETVDDTPMTFVLADSPADRQRQDLLEGGDQTIYAAGGITSGTTKQFLAFVKAHNVTQARVYFDSPGGLSIEGMELGRAIRTLHFNTAVRPPPPAGARPPPPAPPPPRRRAPGRGGAPSLPSAPARAPMPMPVAKRVSSTRAAAAWACINSTSTRRRRRPATFRQCPP